MDIIKDFNGEEFNNLSQEEKEEYVRNLIHSKKADVKIHAAFFNPNTQEMMDLKGLVETIGEEKAIDLIIEALSSSISIKTIDIDGVKDLMLKAEKGECSEEELAMLNFVTHKMERSDDVCFERECIEFIINLINFSQEEVGYNPMLKDLLIPINVLFISSSMLNEKSSLSKYNKDNTCMLLEMGEQIADDIYDTWKSSCTTSPDPELIIIGLLRLISRIACENNICFTKAEDIAKDLGLEVKDDLEENGSNKPCDSNICKPNVYNHTPSSEDKEMRDLLKDD